MKILCNLPLESFEAREQYADAEVVTYGPADRMFVDRRFYPFDVEFDPATGSVHELLSRLPPGFAPDMLLIYWPDQEPIPDHLDESPIPVVGVLSDYNLSLPFVIGLWPFFDTFLVDRQGVDLFRTLSFNDTRYFCQYTFKAPSHRLYPDVERDLDIAFAGNLNPVVQRERVPWIERLRRLAEKGLRVEVRDDVFGADYGRFLNRAWMGFNRSIRSEMNLRAFEVPACGALLLMEEDNLEVRDFLVPDEEVVLYNDENFEDLVVELARDRERCAAIARAGHRRVQDYRMGRRLSALGELLATPGPEKAVSTPIDRSLGRGISLLSTWARGPATTEALAQACNLAPDDPRPLNAMAIALVKEDAERHGTTIFTVLAAACAHSQSYVPAAFNLAYLALACGTADATARLDEAMRRLDQHPNWHDLDGPVMPIGYSEAGIAQSLALARALRELEPEVYVDELRALLAPACV